MDEFCQSDGGERRILISCKRKHLLNQLFDRVPSSLCGDDDTGIEDQSHETFRGSGWLAMTASRSRANSPSRVAVEPCSLARRRDSESRRTEGSAATRRTTAGEASFSI